MSKKQARYQIAGVSDLREILEEQKYRCALTGIELTPQNTSFDHRQPLAKGGTSLKTNLQATTKIANQSKGQLTMAEYIDLCFNVINHAGKQFGYRAVKTTKKQE